MARALIIVDVQNDFCEGGSLAVAGGAAVAESISEYLDEHGHEFDNVAATQDWHVDPGTHFSQSPNFVDSWPVHCKAGTRGADFHPELDTEFIEASFRKGRYAAAYSGFEGLLAAAEAVRPGEREATAGEPALVDEDGETLDEWLRERGVEDIVVVGIATDHCVLATALDGIQAGYNVSVIRELTAAVSDAEGAFEEMEEAGVVLL